MSKREKSEATRQQIIEATDDLLYHKGFNLMSFSDIATASGVPRGNLYYYFKTKDEVLSAVIEYRLLNMKDMLASWTQDISSPLERLMRFSVIPLNELKNVTRYGCPMGSLTTELGKSQQNLRNVAKRQLDLFLDWLTLQFQLMAPKEDAAGLAQHLLVRSQGISTLAQTYESPELVQREVAAVGDWLQEIAARAEGAKKQ